MLPRISITRFSRACNARVTTTGPRSPLYPLPARRSPVDLHGPFKCNFFSPRSRNYVNTQSRLGHKVRVYSPPRDQGRVRGWPALPGELRGENDYLSVELVTRPVDTPITVSLKIRAPLGCLISSTLRAGRALPGIFQLSECQTRLSLPKGRNNRVNFCVFAGSRRILMARGRHFRRARTEKSDASREAVCRFRFYKGESLAKAA